MRYLLGPELFWLVLYTFACIIAKANAAPHHSMDDFIDSCWIWLPLFSLIVFVLWWIPVVEKNWLLPRVWVFGILGGHFVCEKVLLAYSKQGPGSGMVYTISMLFLILLLFVGSVFIKIKF